MKFQNVLILLLIVGLLCLPAIIARVTGTDFRAAPVPPGKTEVVFWHFWGGADSKVVDDVVDRFNRSQDVYHVRAVAMPGNNLQAKLFLAVAGGDPPDLVNQDDPVLADWASRGVIDPVSSFAPSEEVAAVGDWMYDSAYRLSEYEGQLCGVCNGLDVRALFYNRTVLQQNNLDPPATLAELDRIANQLSPPGNGSLGSYAYLPDSRRLWAWGFVHGGDFYDPETGQVELDSLEVISALQWMQGYAARYGSDNVAAFRQGDQSLPGKAFPLLPLDESQVAGRYTFLMDGQWRCRDINAFVQSRKDSGGIVPEFGVCPLPSPAGGRERAGWVNGNFFVVPHGAKNRDGAWEFMKFWIGFEDAEQAARTCAEGGWIPVSDSVVQSETFQSFLKENELFEEFVSLAGSENQFPVPVIRGAAMFKRTVEGAAFEAMNDVEKDPRQVLQKAGLAVQEHLERVQQ